MERKKSAIALDTSRKLSFRFTNPACMAGVA
jgi:hypothetical protein